jgi:ribosomal protein S18 acetylase RimI-like enzyme
MTKAQITEVTIQLLGKNQPIPYELLLLADPSKKLIDIYLQTAEVYVATVQQKIIGAYMLYPSETGVMEIKNISVEDDYQNKGIGTLMLRDAAAQAKQKGFTTIIIGTGNTSIGQLYLYQKEGFEITGIKKNFFVDNYSELLYENGIQVKHMIMLAKQI